MNAQLAPKYFPVKVSQTELSQMSEWAIVALYSKYKSANDWESTEAHEYAQSIYLSATAGAVTQSETDTEITSDDEIDAECSHRILNGFSSRCFCGNHADFSEVLYV